MADHRLDHRLRHQRRPGIVEVRHVLAPGGFPPGPGDVQFRRRLVGWHPLERFDLVGNFIGWAIFGAMGDLSTAPSAVLPNFLIL